MSVLLGGVLVGGGRIGQSLANTTYDTQADWDTGTLSNVDTVTTAGSTVLRRAFVDDANTLLLDHLDGNANDSSSYANHGTANVTWNTTRKIGSHSAQFPSLTSNIFHSDIAAYDVTTAITVEAWVLKTSTNTVVNYVLVRGQADLGAIWAFVIRDDRVITPKVLQALISVNGGSYNLIAEDTVAFPLNTWTHVAFTYDGTTLTVWKDGVSVATNTLVGTLNTGNQGIYLGDNIGVDQNLLGSIDEARVSDSVRYPVGFTPQPYATSGTWTSPVIDTGTNNNSASQISWTEVLPTANEDITWGHRASNTNPPTGAYTALTGGSPITSGFVDTGRYHQIQATLTTVASSVNTPSLDSATFRYTT